MSDRYRCLDCARTFRTLTRWVAARADVSCPACGSPGVQRTRTFWGILRDAMIVANAA